MNNTGLTKEDAMMLVDRFVTKPHTRAHLLETEAIMRALARRCGENEDDWGIIGLLHDVDWDMVQDHVMEHCIVCQDLLRSVGGTEYLIENIISHGYDNASIPALQDKKRTTAIQYCLVAAETLTGLIIATTLMQPDKKLSSVSIRSLQKKFKTASFAARCDRDLIRECEKANIPLEEFLTIGLVSLQDIGDELGF